MSTWVTGTTVVENSVDTENLTSNVTITLIVGWNGGSWASDNPAYYINVNGSRVKSGTANFNTGQATTGSQTIATWTGNVPHNSDGTGSMTWAVGYEGIYAGEGNYSTASGTKTLTPIEIPDPDPPTPTGDGNYLDKTGLAYFFGKLKAMFAKKDEVVTSVNGQTGDVIVEGGEGGGTSNNMVTLWTNPNPTANFSAQTITLSQSADDFDILIVETLYGNWGTPCKASSIIFPSIGRQKLMCGQDNTGSGVGMRDITPNGTSVTFGQGHSNNASSESQSASLCIPQVIYGAKIKGVGKSSQLEVLWTNSAPTSAFAQQTVSLDLTNYDAVLIECNTSGNTDTGKTIQFGLVGSTIRLMAEIYQIHRRLATINSDGITFGNNYYLPAYANGNETASNGYLIPTRIYGLRAVKPKVGKTLLWTNPSPTANFNAQTVTLSKDANQYDMLMVESRYGTTEDSISSSLLEPTVTTRQTVMSARYVVNATTTIVIRDATINGNQITFTTGRYIVPNGMGEGTQYAIPLKIYGINFSGASSPIHDVLWTNPSPSASFASQTINLDLSKYRFVMIDCVATKDYANHLGFQTYEVGSTNCRYQASVSNKIGQRNIDRITTTGIVFSSGYVYGSYGASPTVDNTVVIPYRIYGVL